MPHTIVIAEVGENHIGDIGIAKRLIEDASSAGVDYVKFQSYKPKNFKTDDPEYEWFKRVYLSDKAHRILKEHADNFGVKFLSSPFSLERAQFLCEELGLKEIKIASAVLRNLKLLDYLDRHAEIIFLSTGMATIAEVKDSLSRLKRVAKCYILHCVTQYPCEHREANLLAIKALQREFPAYEIGYSDHTAGHVACLAAVSLGAKVIEKHLTFDKKAKEGTDHVISVEPDELKDMTGKIREIELLLGTDVKEPVASELKIKNFVRNRFI